MKYMNGFLAYFKGFPIFSANDVKLFFHKNGANGDYYKIFMHNLINKNRIFRIKKGCYTAHNDLMVAGFAFSPFYYGLETALTYHKLWDYVTPITIITTKKVRNGIREILGRNVSVRRISKKMLFGYDTVNYEDKFYVPIADMEKTLIDSVYFNASFNEEVYRSLISKVNKKKLNGYLKNYSEIINIRVRELVKSYGR